MTLIEHGLVKYEYQSNSYEPYCYYCECKCGWQTRLGTEQAAKSQFDHHLLAHGKEVHFSKVMPEVDTVEEDKREEFNPFK